MMATASMPTTTSDGGSGPAAPALELTGVTKTFGPVTACRSVDLSVQRGEIHGLLGENGAGKSTLMKVLVGVHRPDAGEIRLHGRSVTIPDPIAAARVGLAMVHQHFSVIQPLTVWENVTLGEPGRLEPDRARHEVTEVAARYGFEIEPDAIVGTLTPGQRQRVEIIKCLRRNPDIVILDEPTSVLTSHESAQLFEVLRAVVAEEGRSVVLISHKLNEILSATDAVTVMRKAEVVARHVTAGVTPQRLARDMIGREVSLRGVDAAALGLVEDQPASAGAERLADETEPPVLEVRGATLRRATGELDLDGLSLAVHRGEIVGLLGVEGNGQSPLTRVLASLLALDGGEVLVDGAAVPTGSPGALHRAGVSVIPDERHEYGCLMNMTVAENLAYMDLDPLCRRGVVSQRRLKQRARALMAEYQVQASSCDAPMWTLSGGNQQRVVLARAMASNPLALVASQPTHGLDVGAIEDMTRRLEAAAAAGVAVLLISTEVEEILALSHRIAVIYRGRVIGEMSRSEATPERIGLLMGGHSE